MTLLSKLSLLIVSLWHLETSEARPDGAPICPLGQAAVEVPPSPHVRMYGEVLADKGSLPLPWATREVSLDVNCEFHHLSAGNTGQWHVRGLCQFWHNH